MLIWTGNLYKDFSVLTSSTLDSCREKKKKKSFFLLDFHKYMPDGFKIKSYPLNMVSF